MHGSRNKLEVGNKRVGLRFFYSNRYPFTLNRSTDMCENGNTLENKQTNLAEQDQQVIKIVQTISGAKNEKSHR